MLFSLFLVILFIKALVMVGIILFSGIGLGPDEAQYWTWSRSLDWGYYSKPPGIAWQIWLGCALFGQTELGVRFGAVCIGTLLPLAVYALARICQMTPTKAFWAGLIMAFTPLGILSSFLAITDGGMVLFWVIAIIVLLLRKDKSLGAIIALGALFKWTMYYFWIVRVIWGIFNRPVFTKQILIGLGISLLGLIPSLIWNSTHDWATFKHVFYTFNVPAESAKLHQSNFFEFIGAQIALLSPVIFFLLMQSLYDLWRRKDVLLQRVCGFITVGVAGSFSLISLFKKLQGNWCDFAYPSGFVWITQYTFDRYKNPQKILFGALSVSLLLISLFFILPLPYKMNPFKNNLGWHTLTQELESTGYSSQDNFLFADTYQLSSLLSFYGPNQKRAYFLNLRGIRHNQFFFWPGMEKEQQGKTGYFVTLDTDVDKYQNLLKPYFNAIEVIGIKPLVWSHDKAVKNALIIKTIGYNGKIPSEVSLY